MRNFLYKIILACFLSYSLNATEFKDEYLQIVAREVINENNIITANGDIVLYSENYYITANQLIYDKNSSKLELFDNINILKNDETVFYGEYVLINVDKEISFIEPLFLMEKQNGLWIKSEKGDRKGSLYSLNNSSLSSCECVKPDWDIRFSQGDYDKADQWINTYNTALYLNDIPVLYTPYFGFSTNKARRSGLLYPTLGLSSTEGLLYSQPLYYAPELDYDFEFIPTIRTKRGYGADMTFRFADSPYSILSLNGGIHRDYEKYRQDKRLSNDRHWGWNLNYTGTKLFSDDNAKEGLYVKLQDMNDVDFESVRYDSKDDYIDRYLESRLKYFYDNYKYYIEVDTYYYNDLEANNNDAVMQILPKANIHKYLDNFFTDDFTYSVDLSLERKDRKTGIAATTSIFELPLGFGKSFFDDFLNIDVTQKFEFINVDFSNDQNKYESLDYASSTNIVSIYSDLIKKYDGFVHGLKFEVSHINENPFYKKGDVYNRSNIAQLDQFALQPGEKTLAFSVDQTFYDSESLKEIFDHRVTQAYVYDDRKTSYIKNYLENEISLRFPFGSLSNKTKYDYFIEDVSRSSTGLNLSYDRYFLNLSHIFTKDTSNLDIEKTLNYKIGVKLNSGYDFSFAQEYDMKLKDARNTRYVLNMDKKCWALSLKFVNSYVASDTVNNSSLKQDILYIQLNLKNLFMLNQVFDFSDS